MEAASQKLPIIATPVAAIPEFIDHKVQGYLSEDDPEKLAAAILECAALEDKGQAMAEVAYARLCTAFRMQPGIDILASRLVNCRGDLAQKAAQ
jgi:glycosyltransferase involved in cell wall biosynthesis